MCIEKVAFLYSSRETFDGVSVCSGLSNEKGLLLVSGEQRLSSRMPLVTRLRKKVHLLVCLMTIFKIELILNVLSDYYLLGMG